VLADAMTAAAAIALAGLQIACMIYLLNRRDPDNSPNIPKIM
jgi:hypothetical protein